MILSARFCALLSALLCWQDGACRAQEVRAALSLWAADAMTKVLRQSPPGSATAPELQAAGNEWEAFQLVLSGSQQELHSTLITGSSLKSAAGHVIPAPVILREHYVEVTAPSERAPESPGWFPDALVQQTVPFDDPPVLTNGRVNQPYWVDIYVPPGTPAGDYSSELVARSVEGTELRLPFQIQVWGFDLPRLPAMRSSICITWRRVAEVHGFDGRAPRAEGKLLGILDDYYDMLVEHRLSPHEVWAAYPDADDPLTEQSYAGIERGLRQHLLERGAGTVGLPLWEGWPFADPLGKDRAAALAYCARYHAIVKKLGALDRFYKIFGELDEPNDARAYAHVREWGSFFAELELKHGAKVPLLITEKPSAEEAAWGSLHGTVDLWVPHVSNVWEDLESANPTREIPRRLAAGEEVWTYTALVQTPQEWLQARGMPEKLVGSQPPVWLMDYPSLNHRILGWLMPIHGITGLTYWDTSYWKKPEHDIWKNAGSYPHENGVTYWGDGLLIYPARQERHGKEGPCASMRLKWIRESADDYDYLHLLEQRGFKQSALEIGASFARGFGDWEPDVQKLYAARKRLGDILHRLPAHAQRE